MRRALILGFGTSMLAAAAMAAPKPPLAPADPTVELPGWKAPRNAMGQPDLSGAWSNATMTPTTRNLQIGKEASLPAEKVKAMEAKFAAALAQRDETKDPNHLPGSAEDKAKDKKLFEVRPDFEFAGGDVGGYNTFWIRQPHPGGQRPVPDLDRHHAGRPGPASQGRPRERSGQLSG